MITSAAVIVDLIGRLPPVSSQTHAMARMAGRRRFALFEGSDTV